MFGKREHQGITREDLLPLFEETGDGVLVVDQEMRIIYWNRAAERTLGFTSDEVSGRYCHEVIGGSDYEGYVYCRDRCPVIECVNAREAIPSYDIYSHRRDGEGLWLNISIIAVADPEGSAPLAVHVFRDVTPRRQAEVLIQQALASGSRRTRESLEGPEIEPCPPPLPRLTRSEKQLLRLLAEGGSTEQIAAAMGLPEASVERSKKGLFAKLGVRSWAEAAIYAAQHRLV